MRMKKRLLSLVLCLVMVFSLFPFVASAAEGERVLVSQKSSDTQDGDLHMTKTLYRNNDGTYDIAIESWATGEVESHVVNQAVPTDFVLILDQSGSMYEQDIPTGYTEAGSSWRPKDFLQVTVNNSGRRGNSMSVNSHDYYYNVPGTNEYYPVYWKNRPDSSFQSINNVHALDCTTYEDLFDIGGYTYENGNCDARYADHMEPMYYRDADGSYYRIYSYSEGLALRYHVTLFYYDSNGNRHDLGTYTYTWAGALNNRVSFNIYTNKYYTRSGSWPRYSYSQHSINNGYKPYYTDANGVEQQLPGSWSVNGEGDVFYNGVLYQKNEEVTRVSALETAVTNFVDLVNQQATTNNVNHKVAVVGFSDSNGSSDNTELLSTGNLSTRSGSYYNYTYKLFPYGYNYNGPEHNGSTTVGGAGGISVENYQAALQDAKTAEGVATLKQAAHAVTACGGTEPEYGFYMAENILKNRTDKTYTDAAGQTQKRNTVVIFFTDGHPGNDDTSDQIAAANKVVTASNRLKTSAEFNNTKVYSIGVFDTGDDQPLTFTKTGQNDADAADNYISHKNISGTEYYFYRGNKVSETSYNDTIKDYMECVSSKYPNATNFLNHAGGTNDTGSKSNARGAENQDQMTYYMRVNDAGGLERAFASIASTVNTSTTSATVNDSAVLRDTVFTGDFDVSNASVTAESVKVHMVDGQVVETDEAGTANPTVTESLTTNGRLSVTGFDYSALYTDANKPGEKLVVTISNVEPKQGGHLWSNSGDAGVYPGENSSDAVLAVASPEENIARVTRVIDFNAPMIISDGMQRWKAVGSNRNGTYNIDDGNFTYQLSSDNQAAGDAVINDAYTSADSALVYGSKVVKPETHAFVDGTGWTQVSTVPASSVYYDDDLADGDAIPVGDGSGYNASVSASPASTNTAKGQYTFTFYGTGIDIYCTTDPNGGYVQAKCGDEVQTVRNYDKTVTRYNVPSISFTGLTAGEHTVTLNVLGSSNYKLDGIRVYNPVSDQSLYADNNAEQEQYAAYINMREALVNNNTSTRITDTFTDQTTNEMARVLFVDDSSKLSEMRQATGKDENGNDVLYWELDENGNQKLDDDGNPIPRMVKVYDDQFDAYQANSPKHEIYLAAKDGNKTQAIVFQLSEAAETAAANGNLWIGLSAPDQNKNTGTVTLKEGKTIDVTSGVDMYYPITSDMIGANRVVTLTNTGSSMISVTNLKITGNKDIYDAAYEPKADTASVNEPLASTLSVEDAISMVFEPMTMRSVKIAANNGVDPDAVVPETPAPEEPVVTPEPTPDPTPAPAETPAPVVTPTPTQAPSVHDIVKQIVSSFVSNLFRSISRLFGN